MNISTKSTKKLKFKKLFNSNILTAFAAVFVAIGLVSLLNVFAAPAPNGKSSEAETPITTINTTLTADSNASGERYLDFNQATVAPPPPTSSERPTKSNTGPRYALTDITPTQFFTNRICNRQRITGDLNFDKSWMKGQTFTLTDCEIMGSVTVYIVGGGVTLPLLDMPIISMDYVDINNGVFALNASKFTADHTYIGNHSQWGLKDVWGPFISEDAPYNIMNSVLYSVYQTQPSHTEALHAGDYGIGYRFTNVSFEQQGGPLTNSGVTATINFHGVNSIFDSCWFIFDGEIPAYYTAYLDAHNSTIKNSWFEKGASGYVYPSSLYKPTFENNKDFNNGEIINLL